MRTRSPFPDTVNVRFGGRDKRGPIDLTGLNSLEVLNVQSTVKKLIGTYLTFQSWYLVERGLPSTLHPLKTDEQDTTRPSSQISQMVGFDGKDKGDPPTCHGLVSLEVPTVLSSISRRLWEVFSTSRPIHLVDEEGILL